MLSTEFHVKIGDVTRGCGLQDGFEDYLPASAFELDVIAGRDRSSTDRHTAIKPIKVATEISPASPRLLELACAQRAVDVEVLLLRYDDERGHDRPYYRYVLHRARIVGVSQRIGGDGAATDAVPAEETLSFVAESVVAENLWTGAQHAIDWP